MSLTPLYDALTAHKKLHRASFHTPGHKNSNTILPRNLLELDLTELPDTDSLYDATGVISESEKLAAALYGTNRTIFSAGGCTLCIQTMIKLTVPFGGKVIASRMIHKSAVNTLALLNADVKWIVPRFSEIDGRFGQVAAQDIEKTLAENSDTACVYITSPDYFGNVADIKAISTICKKHKVPLLVDNAHGSHFKFLSDDIHPITLGADLVADSAHKTLPVLTGGAMLHISNKTYSKAAKNAMSIFGSTSPSYPVMISLELTISWLKKNAKMTYFQLENDISKIKTAAKKAGFCLQDNAADPTRLALHTTKLGFSGDEAAMYFRENGVEPELSTFDTVVFIATPMNSREDFDRLFCTIENFPKREPIHESILMFDLPLVKKSLHDALFSPAEKILSTEALGKISSNTVSPCPPGIPILVPGEVVTQKTIKNLNYYGIKTINVLK